MRFFDAAALRLLLALVSVALAAEARYARAQPNDASAAAPPAQAPIAPTPAPVATGDEDRWLAPDKAAHVFGGYWTAGAGYALAARLDGTRAERRTAALTAGALAGVGKELFDRLVQRERFSWKDLVADAAGIALLVGVTAAAEP